MPSVTSRTIVGRDEPLRTLDEALAAAAEGRPTGTHVAHIFSKLDVHSRMEAAGRARELGLPT